MSTPEGSTSDRAFQEVITASGQIVQPAQRTVLVVDDSKLERFLLRKWLQADFVVMEAESGPAALNVLAEGTPVDLILMDVSMPGKSGIETLEDMRANPDLPQVPVILMSSSECSNETAASSVIRGSHDYLFKPLIKPLLLRKIETILDAVQGKRQADALREIMEIKEKEINELRSFLRDDTVKIRTPLEQITSSIVKLLENPEVKHAEGAQRELLTILQSIRSAADLYKPAMQPSPEEDPVSSSFVGSELLDKQTKTVDTFPSHVEETSICNLTSWDFNQWDLEESQLLPLLKEMFSSFGLLERFKIEEHKLEQFLMTVRSRYHPNPYHCFRHAFDVTQTCYAILTSMNAAKFLSHVDIFALLIAALGHDIGHPGMNNAYQTTALTEIALEYNDKSVLEQFHCSTLFRILLTPACNILSGLSEEEFGQVRSAIIGCIMHTDPAMHFESKAKLQQRLDMEKPLERENADDRQLVIQTVLMTADISNISKPWPVAREWSSRISKEFFAQGDAEREEGRNVAPYMDRNVSSSAKTSANFIDFMAVPLYDVVVQMLPDMQPVLHNIADNRKRLQEILNHERQKDGKEGEKDGNK
eukprot:TRINITY_DN2793_c0_g1_i10.p1 TRINITY_DN2793_c0_g1~~TRINITY_DN2793_c0_g1_i10.p1  ORF type:complete len:591 (-),score=169.42 TRINITY_DN2793_c0_g1_i10:74-1846(-)